MSTDRKLIVIGAGPAGLTAALYTARNGFAPLVLEGASPGGQLMTTTEVENYPGFAEGIMGPALMMAMREQAARFEAELVQQDVESVDLSERPFTIQAGGEQYKAEALIIATGARANLLGLDAETELMGRGVSVCATCDGPFFRDKDILVIGGGDSAMEEATFLTRFAKKVTIVHRRDELRASRIMAERAKNNEKIDFIWSHTLADILGDKEGGVTGAQVQHVNTGDIHEVECQGVFMAIGHTPNTDFLAGQVELDAKGYAVTSDCQTATSVEGVFAAGDVVDSRYRQAITAAGMGCMAALDAQRFLEANE
jgi:thioredoxin reductase (NADPH)